MPRDRSLFAILTHPLRKHYDVVLFFVAMTILKPLKYLRCKFSSLTEIMHIFVFFTSYFPLRDLEITSYF